VLIVFSLHRELLKLILVDEPLPEVVMSQYGHKVIRLPNPDLRLYFCESLTLQFDRMGEACRSTADHDYTTGSPSRALVGHRV
jgi:hypothetical protein